MTKAELQISSKKINAELLNLNPSATIQLFDIEIGNIAFEQGIPITVDDMTFRFHNNVNLNKDVLYFGGLSYIAAPINAEGFETNLKGTLPTPKISISTNPGDITALSTIKQKVRELNDLVGAKVTRTRTFLKFLDANNFDDNYNPEANPNAYLSKDIYFIDRKSLENKYTLEFELATIWDIQDVRLPSRTILASKCPAAYRGEGCLYEFGNRLTTIHGNASQSIPNTFQAPPVANEHNERIISIIKAGSNYLYPNTTNPVLSNKGAWVRDITYNGGNNNTYDYVYIEKNSLKYYFVARRNVPVGISPPNKEYWIADVCAKDLKGCKLRWTNNTLFNGSLPFNGFAAANKLG